MIHTIKITFAVFIVGMLVALIAFRSSMNAERWTAYFILDVACLCQMLFGQQAATRRKRDEVLVFRTQGMTHK